MQLVHRIWRFNKYVWYFMQDAILVHAVLNLLKPTGYVMHQQFNIQQL